MGSGTDDHVRLRELSWTTFFNVHYAVRIPVQYSTYLPAAYNFISQTTLYLRFICFGSKWIDDQHQDRLVHVGNVKYKHNLNCKGAQQALVHRAICNSNIRKQGPKEQDEMYHRKGGSPQGVWLVNSGYLRVTTAQQLVLGEKGNLTTPDVL